MAIGSISLMNGLWLWGAVAAVGVPVLAHLLGKARRPAAVFPSIRFIEMAVADRHRLVKVRYWLLLLLRAMGLGLIVAAFAQPVWYRGDTAGSTSKAAVYGLVLDRSASMNTKQGAASLFDEAQQRVILRLRSLDPTRDQATVVLVDANPRSVLPEPTANFSQLIGLVKQTAPTFERGQLGPAMRLAAQQVKAAQALKVKDKGFKPLGWIELFSDMQATQGTDSLVGALVPGGVELVIEKINRATHHNLAVYGAQIRPGPVVAGQPASVSVEVGNFGESGQQDVHLQLNYAGYTATKKVAVTGGQTQQVVFKIHPKQVGLTWVDIKIIGNTGDNLGIDNSTGLVFLVEQARAVAVVSSADVDDPSTAVYYLARALVPDAAGDISDAALSLGMGVQIEHWPVEELANRLRENQGKSTPAVVVLVEAGVLDRGSLVGLREYLSAGGGVVWIVDTPKAVGALDRFNGLNHNGRLGAIIHNNRLQWATEDEVQLGWGRFDEPILSVFQGPARGELMRQRFGQVMPRSAVGGAGGANVLLAYSDGSPALAWQRFGRGRLAVWTAGIGPNRSNMVKGPAFVPLVHQLVRHVAAGPVGLHPVHPGDRASVQIANPEQLIRHGQLIIRGPSGGAVGTTIAPPVGKYNKPTVEFKALAMPGRYTVQAKDGGTVLGGVQVELDPAESDLRVAKSPAGLLDEIGKKDSENISKANHDKYEATIVDRQGIALWGYLVVAGIVLICMELVVASRWMGEGRGGVSDQRGVVMSNRAENESGKE